MKKAKGKAIRIVLISVGVFALTYAVGGMAAGAIVCSATFNHRGSNVSDLGEKAEYLMYRSRNDYPLMAERTEISIPNGEETLACHYYSVPSPKGTVLYAHGMNSLCDGPEASVQNHFLEKGYSVAALDLSACGYSEGTSMKSLLRSGDDVAIATKRLSDDGLLRGKTIYCGYSWGGYGVARAVHLGQRPDKLIAFSAFDCAYEMMVATAASRSAGLSNLGIPPFALGVLMGNGAEAFDHVSEAIKKEDVPCFLVQGEKDEMVPRNGVSLFEAMGEKKQGYLSSSTHVTPWFSEQARKYISEEIIPILKDFDFAKSEDKSRFLSLVDKEKSSELDEGLFAALDAFLS